MKFAGGITKISILTFVCILNLSLSWGTYADDGDDLQEKNLFGLLFTPQAAPCFNYPYCDITQKNVYESREANKQNEFSVQRGSNPEFPQESMKKQ